MSDTNSYNPVVGDALPKIGIVGCGAIGGEIARAVDSGNLKYELASLCDIHQENALALKAGITRFSPAVVSLDALAMGCDVVFEAAHPDAVSGVVNACKGLSRTIVVMSVGGIPEISPVAFEELSKSDSKLYLPSGAMGGVDAILAMREAGLVSVSLTTTKPPKALGRNDEAKTVVFEGGADEAVEGEHLRPHAARQQQRGGREILLVVVAGRAACLHAAFLAEPARPFQPGRRAGPQPKGRPFSPAPGALLPDRRLCQFAP